MSARRPAAQRTPATKSTARTRPATAPNETPDALLEAARTEAEQLRTAAQALHSDAVREAEELSTQARQDLEEATEKARRLRTEAAAEADRLRTEVQQDLADATEKAERLRAEAAAEADRLLESARLQADRLQALTQEQISAAEQTVARTRAIVDVELVAVEQTVERRREAAASVADHAQRDAEQTLAAAREAGDKAIEQARADGARLVEDAEAQRDALLEEAATEAEQQREQARQLLLDAEAKADEVREQAAQFWEEAEQAAREAREQAQRLQNEAAERMRQASEQAAGELTAWQHEARKDLAELDRQARAARGKAEAEGARIVAQANADAAAATAKAAAEVRQAQDRVARLRAEEEKFLAAQEQRKDSRGAKVSEFVWKRLAPAVALAAAIGMTATGEFALAALVGVPVYLAWLLPTCVDVWAMSAMRAKRGKEVASSLATMITANATYHVAAAHLLGMAQSANGTWHPQWELIVLVACIAPIVVWRVHALIDADDHPAPKAAAPAAAPVREPVPAPPAAAGAAPREAERGERGEREASVYAPADAHPAALTGAQPAPAAALTERPSGGGRAQNPALTAPSGTRSPVSKGERPVSPRGERAHLPEQVTTHERASAERAQPRSVSAAPALTERRMKVVSALYPELERRPEWREISAALMAAKLTETPMTRPSAQRLRDRVEERWPALKQPAALNAGSN
ncbi:hypothetical protein ACEZCY_35955 [Streptacidiphilus sp. N1-12]|uniref:Uncharacterized protein n=1 Tax=Streptacidiphilus alkalitolerans TaxID=3342712 RepID=A0ABV6WRA0_9ACTN